MMHTTKITQDRPLSKSTIGIFSVSSALDGADTSDPNNQGYVLHRTQERRIYGPEDCTKAATTERIDTMRKNADSYATFALRKSSSRPFSADTGV